jgi:hypothetical protein
MNKTSLHFKIVFLMGYKPIKQYLFFIYFNFNFKERIQFIFYLKNSYREKLKILLSHTKLFLFFRFFYYFYISSLGTPKL